jgi:hypothetical protein
MRKSVAEMFVLVFLIASSIIMAKPALSSEKMEENSWMSKAPMQQARAGLGVAAANGKIYAIGGSTASEQYPPPGGFVGTNEEYDPKTDTWTTKAPMPTPRDYFAIATYQNKIYCIGGAVGFSYDERTGFYGNILSGVNEVYDPETDTWMTKKSMPYNGSHLRAEVVNGKIYVLQSFILHVYEPATDIWQTEITTTPFTPPQGTGSPPALTVIDNKIIVTGEFSTGFGSSEQKVLIYDTEAYSWSEGTSGPTIVVCGAVGATTGVKAPKRVYVLGVPYGFPNPINNQVYDLEADAWTAATPLPTHLMDFGVAVVNDVLYLVGGYYTASREAWLHGLVTPVAVNEQYIPIGYSSPPEIKIVSPENQTYNGSSVSLVFTVNKPVNWTGYSLDGQENVSLTGNTTINGLSNGLHNITVYAKGEFENTGTSETISFTVAEEPFPSITLAAVASVSVAVAGLGMFIFLRKRKR